MPILPADHPERYILADEVHARPPESISAPTRATHLAVLVDAEAREEELAHVESLCRRFAVDAPSPGARHFRAVAGPVVLKWERHGEFSSYTFIAHGVQAGGQPFAETAASLMPAGWVEAIPGRTVAAVNAEVLSTPTPTPDLIETARHFGGATLIGSQVADGAALAFTDFRIHPDGCSRFIVLDRSMSQRQAGRTLQRLFEIEAYRMMALLALPIARRQSPRVLEIEQALAGLTDHIATGQGDDEALLHELTRLAAEVESGLAATQFRFGACNAYFEIVQRRIDELREARVPGVQTIEEFMSRRLTPAVATCRSVSQRMHGLSERVAQASGLLSTRVDIARERQNQSLLASMDRRAKLQLRLQQTVEGLSVAAITYYVLGVIGYLAKGAKAAGAPINTDLAVGAALPVVVVAVLMMLRRARRHLAKDLH